MLPFDKDLFEPQTGLLRYVLEQPYSREMVCNMLGLNKQVQQLTATVILLGTVLLLCPLASSFSELAVFSAAHGLMFGATVAIHITVLAEVVSVNRLGGALGFFLLIRGSRGLLGPPIAGFFIDKMRLQNGVLNVRSGSHRLGSILAPPSDELQGSNTSTKNIDAHGDKTGQSGRAKAKEMVAT